MIAAVLLEAVAIVAIVYLMLRAQRANDAAWTAERRELLTRIQRPELLPAPIGNPFVWPEDNNDDEIGLIGSIAEPPLDGGSDEASEAVPVGVEDE